MNGYHENLMRRGEARPGSERGFGLTFAAIFMIVGLWPVFGSGRPAWLWVVAAVALAVTSFALPHWLAVPNRLWHHLGRILAAIVSPIALAIVYFGTIVPTGLLMRMRGMDPLRLRRDPSARSYWINREPAGPDSNTFDRQF